mmetsp:Transcript_2301/g.3204  ORF Transcript_2301/g.3204 Transcript_2301/m.3204 type:complete len:105 (+) Transcript_2301:245-559(+)
MHKNTKHVKYTGSCNRQCHRGTPGLLHCPEIALGLLEDTIKKSEHLLQQVVIDFLRHTLNAWIKKSDGFLDGINFRQSPVSTPHEGQVEICLVQNIDVAPDNLL